LSYRYLFSVGLIIFSQLAFATEDIRSTAHPVIGYWKSTFADSECVETYLFNEDGTGKFTSGKEVTDIRYEVSAQPNMNGFFKLLHMITASNGEQDCSGAVSPTKAAVVSYMLFQPDGRSFVSCDTDSVTMEFCFGPMHLEAKSQR